MVVVGSASVPYSRGRNKTGSRKETEWTSNSVKNIKCLGKR